ncbi:hypothetical protein [Burkholderia gladioli]|uniref:hypothetical protein n=1 Tax=Burkholderia gladioli TaxID=28095 RepID=UPI001FC8C5BA|nr:hypothetical protein [Burkholderia gladioli]
MTNEKSPAQGGEMPPVERAAITGSGGIDTVRGATPANNAAQEHTTALTALQAAKQFISNGIEFGYIRMPESSTDDPAHLTPKLIDDAIALLTSPRAAVQASANLEDLRKKLLTPREIIRDEQGWLTHPDMPCCDEDVRADELLAAFHIDTAFVSMESDGNEDACEAYFERGDADCSAWTPTPPTGEGWLLLEIYDTEDGPYALYGRDRYEVERAEKRAHTKRLRERLGIDAAPAAPVAPDHSPGATKMVAAQAVAADGALLVRNLSPLEIVEEDIVVMTRMSNDTNRLPMEETESLARLLYYIEDLRRAAVSPATAGTPLNGISATMFHGEGAIARCSYCGRYSIDPKTLGDRQPKCECGEKHGWSGSFEKPGPDAKWSGAAPAAADSRHVGDSQFESWYPSYIASAPVHVSIEQRCRDAYAAGMRDATPQPATAEARAAFERWMVEDEKCIVGSTDPYPAGIERQNWKVWRAAWARASQAAAPAEAREPVGSVRVNIVGPAREVSEPIFNLSQQFEALLDASPGTDFKLYAAPANAREHDDPEIIAASNRGYAAGLRDGKALGACGPLAADAGEAVAPVVAALRKLVHLKSLKDGADRCVPGYIEDRIEYQRDKPKAWDDARAALASFDAAQGAQGGKGGDRD